jgi:hypothetical protein
MRKILLYFAVLLFLLPTNLPAAPPPHEVAKTVTFIFLADTEGNVRISPDTREPIPNGTGFFSCRQRKRPGEAYGYLVTARHVLLDEHGLYYKRVFIRLNRKNGEAAFVALDLAVSGDKKNVFTHSDASTDIAIIPVWPDEHVFDVLEIPMAMIKSKEDFKKTSIVEGSDVFFVGLFVAHYGDKANTPIFRFGRVAMLTDDRIRWQEQGKPPELVQLYLLETMSFGGNSGAPVFFSQSRSGKLLNRMNQM